jgi:hypothetical protein
MEYLQYMFFGEHKPWVICQPKVFRDFREIGSFMKVWVPPGRFPRKKTGLTVSKKKGPEILGRYNWTTGVGQNTKPLVGGVMLVRIF